MVQTEIFGKSNIQSRFYRIPISVFRTFFAFLIKLINSLRLSDTYMCQQNIPSLVQITTCHLFGAKPSSEPKLTYYQFNTWEQISVKLKSKGNNFHEKQPSEYVVCKMATNFCQPQCFKSDSLCNNGLNTDGNHFLSDKQADRDMRNFNQNSNIFNQELAFENAVCKMASIWSQPQWVNFCYISFCCNLVPGHPQCWKFPQARQSEADNFGGGPGTFCWFFFNFMFMIWHSRHEDVQLFWLSLKHWSSDFNSITVASCAKLCSDHFIQIWMKTNWNFHQIWKFDKKPMSEMSPRSSMKYDTDH